MDKREAIELLKTKGKDYDTLKSVLDQFSSDKDVFWTAMEVNPAMALIYVPVETRNEDRDFALKAVKLNGKALIRLGAKMRADREIVMEAIKTCPTALEHAENFVLDEEFQYAACESAKRQAQEMLNNGAEQAEVMDYLTKFKERMEDGIAFAKERVEQTSKKNGENE